MTVLSYYPNCMAREPAERTRDESIESGHERRVDDGNNGLLSRRSYLGAAGAALAALPVAVGSATAAEYETVTVSSGEHKTINVEDGETYENVLIDVTASGATATIVAHGTDWTIRNVGFKGRLESPDEVCLGVSDRQGGTSRIENVYIGDGASTGHRDGLGIWVAPEHSGHIDIERTNIQEMGDNSFYCSAPGSGGGGTVDIDRCYSANSWVAHFRLSEGSVTNSVAVNDERHKDGRGVWAWAPGPVTVDNCQLAMNGNHYSVVAGANGAGGPVEVTNTEYDTGFNGGSHEPDGSITWGEGNGTDPQDVVPEGVPTSAEEAASGGSDAGSQKSAAATTVSEERQDADSETDAESEPEPEAEESEPQESEAGNDQPSELANTFLIEGAEDAPTRYEFVVSGAVEPSTYREATIDDAHFVEDTAAGGVVANWRDAFAFDGELEELRVDGPGTVYVNDEEVEPDAGSCPIPR